MKLLSIEQQAQLTGGDDCDVVTVAGAISCAGAMFWPIGTAIFGPSCAGMIIVSAIDC